MDYACPQRRKNKNDRRAKARFNKFKRGGAFRSMNVNESGRQSEQGQQGQN